MEKSNKKITYWKVHPKRVDWEMSSGILRKLELKTEKRKQEIEKMERGGRKTRVHNRLQVWRYTGQI